MHLLELSLAVLFVFLAGFNVWNMLTARGKTPRSARIWTQVHRAAGYAFVALFLAFLFFMMMRVRGLSDELPPRLILHMALALAVAPLLATKIIVARYQKAARGLLTALGVGILLAAFTLVGMNVAFEMVRAASSKDVPARFSAIFVAAAVLASAGAFLWRPRQMVSRAAEAAGGTEPAAALVPSPPGAFELTLARIHPQTAGAKTLRFVLPPGRRIHAKPGQFLTFEFLIDGKPATRSYSICSSATQSQFVEITPKRVANGHVSTFLNECAPLGMKVKARGPYGRFCFDEHAHRCVVMIAGGSGITPMISMLRYMDDLCLDVNVTLIHCVRTEQDVMFEQELIALESRLRRFRHVLVVSQPARETRWHGRLRRDVLEHEIEKLLESSFFLCGPPALMDHARKLLLDLGVPSKQILQESFGAAVIAPTPDGAGPPASITAGFTARLLRSTAAIGLSSGETVLQAAERQGIVLPSGCRQGVCGTCATRLIAGNVRMDAENGLSDDKRARGYILPCVSHALTDLDLDV